MEVSYVMYNLPTEVKALDLNKVTGPIINFPGYLYGAEPFSIPQYVCSGPRDITQHYFYPNETQHHPNSFSRFSYAACPNTYCQGVQTRGYNTNLIDCRNYQPKDMAPEKFYSYKSTSPFYA
jgi:hypothetical protein